MKKLMFLMVLLLLFLPVFVMAGGKQEGGRKIKSVDDWERWAKLGKYRPKEDNWDEIIEAAKKEGSVVVYSNSSRVFEFCRTFYNKYGIKAEPNDLGTVSLMEKLSREQNAGVYNADVILVGDAPTFINEFFATGMVYSFIPSDIYPKLEEKAKKEPLAIHHYGAKVVMYNTEKYKKPPIDSWWDMTRPEWKGKLVTKDPLKSGSEFNLFALIVRHSDEMARLYKEEFGEDIVLHGTENAGYEFLKRLIQNGLVLFGGGGDVASAVGARHQTSPPLGITSYSKLRTADENNLSLGVILDLKPVAGFYTKALISIAKFAKHPNAAKLMVWWMMGGPGGKELAGYEPYHVLGDWSPRTDIEEPKGQVSLDSGYFWEEDTDWLYKNAVKVRDFWIQHM